MPYEEEDTCIPLGGLSHEVKFKQDEIYGVFCRARTEYQYPPPHHM
jgi:hypothetical protein